MFIVLPNSLGGLENLIKKISLTKISEMRYYLTAQLVQLIIPKFKFNFHAKLAPILQKVSFFGNRRSLWFTPLQHNDILNNLPESHYYFPFSSQHLVHREF